MATPGLIRCDQLRAAVDPGMSQLPGLIWSQFGRLPSAPERPGPGWREIGAAVNLGARCREPAIASRRNNGGQGAALIRAAAHSTQAGAHARRLGLNARPADTSRRTSAPPARTWSG
ncbi:hypothetical protein [Lysobacter gummosus]|uniref:hypothetical protein n=1 Tax=Lysobacter gummosus TaxID=262324 RepID=UPI003632A708